ncbi:amino acid permease [Hyphomicrobium methylovorum]|uniref:APC family permease n=1 Tax=Hyphomicrobium methylovorum TaxID=84 RepID=UPI0015E7601F|nr:APC family permease [Hyphomicrobium methylovorum]MBA2126951.1 amino acid permease [Hyphomicrobium methylovorum]
MSEAVLAATSAPNSAQTFTMHRTLNWTHAFWFAAGTPVLVLFSIGAVASAAGNISAGVWILSMLIGFAQCFTYAEISGLFPKKSGGASVYGAIAWVRYGKMLGPISVWANWFSWSPVLAIGSGLAAGYVLNLLFPADSLIRTWQVTLFDLSFIKEGVVVRFNATFFLGLALMLTVFAIQHRGILKAARVQMIVAIAVLLPLLLTGIVPLLTGDVRSENFTPFVPLIVDAAGNPTNGAWDMVGITTFMACMLLAAWSTYPFETAVCYVSEFKNPGYDTVRALLYSGLLCIAFYTLVPIAFQGYLGLQGLLDPGIYDGTGVGKVLAQMVGAGPILGNLIICVLTLSICLVVMTAMAGSSRTLYQGSHDGWLPKYLSRVNSHGAPVAAMWTDLAVNAVLLSISDYVFLIVLANTTYMVFVFLNLQAGWLHRIDRPNAERPYRAQNWLLAIGAVCGFINLLIMGWGADFWGQRVLLTSILIVAGIIPIFAYRHYVTDKGKFPPWMQEDLEENGQLIKKRAGMLPYLTLIAGGLTVYLGSQLAAYHVP